MSDLDSFAAFILTHGRPGNVSTYRALRRHGYTGRIVLVTDDLDDTIDEYRRIYGDQVYVFDKRAAAAKVDICDNQPGLDTVTYARAACFDIAKELGLSHFVQLDDDYVGFRTRFNGRMEWVYGDVKSLDLVFSAFVEFMVATPARTIAMAQPGDFIGGAASRYGSTVTLTRKAMNSFFCDTDRPVGFLGRMNDDVNTYVLRAVTGALFFTHNFAAIDPTVTQQTPGGLTEMYLKYGTYVKSFYTVMLHPSAVSIRSIASYQSGKGHPRLHHSITWRQTTPMILREDVRK